MITKSLGLVEILKVLSDEINLKILAFLKLKGKLCVCDLQNLLSTNQSNVSRHLKELKDVELINVSQEGKWHYYSLKVIPPFTDQIIENAIEEYGLRNLEIKIGKCD